MDFLVVIEERGGVRGFVKFADVGLGNGGDAVQCHGGNFLRPLFIVADGAGFNGQSMLAVDALAQFFYC